MEVRVIYFAQYAMCDCGGLEHTHMKEWVNEWMNGTWKHPGFSLATLTQGRARGSARQSLS